jgi:hypothetical protein
MFMSISTANQQPKQKLKNLPLHLKKPAEAALLEIYLI